MPILAWRLAERRATDPAYRQRRRSIEAAYRARRRQKRRAAARERDIQMFGVPLMTLGEALVEQDREGASSS